MPPMTERAGVVAKLAFKAHPHAYDTQAVQAHLGLQQYSAQGSLYRAIARSV